jgi:hypothetical protein
MNAGVSHHITDGRRFMSRTRPALRILELFQVRLGLGVA